MLVQVEENGHEYLKRYRLLALVCIQALLGLGELDWVSVGRLHVYVYVYWITSIHVALYLPNVFQCELHVVYMCACVCACKVNK